MPLPAVVDLSPWTSRLPCRVYKSVILSPHVIFISLSGHLKTATGQSARFPGCSVVLRRAVSRADLANCAGQEYAALGYRKPMQQASTAAVLARGLGLDPAAAPVEVLLNPLKTATGSIGGTAALGRSAPASLRRTLWPSHRPRGPPAVLRAILWA